MKMRDLMVATLGGAVIYVAMAACNGGDSTSGASAATDETCQCEARKTQVDVVECQKADDGAYYATMEYPGATVADLALVRTISQLPNMDNQFDGLWTHSKEVYLDDGVVKVICPTSGSTTVTFVRP